MFREQFRNYMNNGEASIFWSGRFGLINYEGGCLIWKGISIWVDQSREVEYNINLLKERVKDEIRKN